LSFKYVFGASASNIAQGFLALCGIPVLGILAWITELITAEYGQRHGQDDQQCEPFE